VAAIPELTTERLRLRAFDDRDREVFAAMNGDPAVMEHFPATLTRDDSDALLDRILARWATDGFGLWAVDRVADGAFLGFAGVARLAWLEQPEIGWRFVPSAWGHGYATEAGRAALRFGFAVVGAPEIMSVTATTNERSMAVMRRLGMHRDPADDFLHPNLPVGHRLRPHVMYRLRREEWEAASGGG
jgi:RimJ/RimL family protein N-acetyltransferase